MLKKLLPLFLLLVLAVAPSAQAAASPRMVAKSFFQAIANKDSNQYCLLTRNNLSGSRLLCRVDIEEWFNRSGRDYARDRKAALAALHSISYSRVDVKGNQARVSFPGRNIESLYLVNTREGVWRLSFTAIPIFTG